MEAAYGGGSGVASYAGGSAAAGSGFCEDVSDISFWQWMKVLRRYHRKRSTV